jgi:hypothetical protein
VVVVGELEETEGIAAMIVAEISVAVTAVMDPSVVACWF